MSANTLKIEKKLTTLKTNKQKEEEKLADSVSKLTEKYNEDSKKLKETFDSKVGALKTEANTKIASLKKEIEFYENKRKEVIKLEQQLAALQGDIDQRIASSGSLKLKEGE